MTCTLLLLALLLHLHPADKMHEQIHHGFKGIEVPKHPHPWPEAKP